MSWTDTSQYSQKRQPYTRVERRKEENTGIQNLTWESVPKIENGEEARSTAAVTSSTTYQTEPVLDDEASELFAAFDNDELSEFATAGSKAIRLNPHEVWKKTLSQLEMQLPASTFNTWVRDSFVQAYEDGEFIICSNNAYARDWLQNRLRQMIKRILSSIVGRQIQVQFTVRPQRLTDQKGVTNTPLYTLPNPEEANDERREDNSVNSVPVTGTPSQPRNSVSLSTSEHTISRQPFAQTGLKPSYTFDTFVVGKHNQLASAAAMSIVDKPGKRFNPLFVYGGVGLGKTHLLHAVGNRLYQRGFKTLYCTSEQFTNELITAIRSQSTDEFRNKYRELDLLLIDDIQFIGGKDSTQEEFFHTFNHLFNSGKQVVISSDKLPKSVPTLENRLRSRFEGGLQVDISLPDFETRVAILEAKARDRHLEISLEVLKEIAGRVESNVRELEGALNKLAIQAELFHSHLDVGMARHILQDLNPERKPCTPTQTIEIVARHYRLTPDDLVGLRRTKEVAHARHIAMYLLRTIHNLSLPTIGQQLGGRDHTTISHGVEKVGKEQAKDELLRRELLLLREKVHSTQ